jgi:hypothetical protein
MMIYARVLEYSKSRSKIARSRSDSQLMKYILVGGTTNIYTCVLKINSIISP